LLDAWGGRRVKRVALLKEEVHKRGRSPYKNCWFSDDCRWHIWMIQTLLIPLLCLCPVSTGWDDAFELFEPSYGISYPKVFLFLTILIYGSEVFWFCN
jgi:hypothetical protein